MTNPTEHHRAEAERRRNHARLATVAMAIFIVAAVATFILGNATARPSVGVMVPAFVLIGGGIISMVFVIAARDKMRRHEMAAALAAQGMEVDAAPSKERREDLFMPFRSLKALHHGAKSLRLWASGRIDNQQVFLIEHTYTVHAGNSHQRISHTAAAVAAAPSWPVLSLKGQNLVTGWWANLRGHDMKLENDAFNERWIVRAENEDFALMVLTPQVQEYLCQGPSGETWQIGSGWICWYRQKSLKIGEVGVPIERLMGLVRLLPPELAHWRP